MLGSSHPSLTMMQPDRPLPNSYWVIPRRFLAGEYPGNKDGASGEKKIKCLLQAGIDTFIDLTEHHELTPYEGLLQKQKSPDKRELVYRRLPITDVSVPRSPGVMKAILDAIESFLHEGRNLYLHCWGGVGRTGTVVGCYLRSQGMDGNAALKQLAEWWTEVEKRHRSPFTPETQEQCDYVRHWAGGRGT